MVLMLVVVTATIAVLIMVVMMVFFVMVLMNFVLKLFQFSLKSAFLFHSLKNLSSIQFRPWSCNQSSIAVVLADKLYTELKLVRLYTICMAENYRSGILYLVVKKFTEVFHIHFAFIGINNSCEGIKHSILCLYVLHSTDNIGKLAHTRGFNKYTVGRKLIQNLFECFAKIAHKATANTAGIHLGNLYTGILQKSTVDTDFTKLVFNKHKLFTLVRFLYKLFNQGSFTRSQKS